MPKFMHTNAAARSPEHYAELRREQRRRYYAQTSFMYPKKRWADWEDTLVLNSNMTDRELADVLGRSMKAIANRRWRLKNMQDTDGGDT